MKGTLNKAQGTLYVTTDAIFPCLRSASVGNILPGKQMVSFTHKERVRCIRLNGLMMKIRVVTIA